MDSIKRVLGNPVSFVVGYLVLMMPTYFLPYVGSNSAVIGTLGAAAGAGINPATLIHLASMLALIFLCRIRGAIVGKTWLIIFPVLALVFDFLPGLSMIPLVPTVMHLLAIIYGVASTAAATAGARPAQTTP